MRPKDRALAEELETGLLDFDKSVRPLPGIRDLAKRDSLLEQLIESIRRIEYVKIIASRNISKQCANPNHAAFDPLKAAILFQRSNRLDEAFWMVFLFVHFGRHSRGGWRYAREVYSGLSNAAFWDWESVSANADDFREWLDVHQDVLNRAGAPGGFGNHRRYESLNAYSPNGTGAVVESYVRWVNPPRTHQELFTEAHAQAGADPKKAFDNLYKSMSIVARFGRLARFDYLTMVGKLGLASVEPGSAYLQGSTGPLNGAKLLFGNQHSASDLDEWLVELGGYINVGMQVLEDSLCNWQKSPDEFKPFRG